jgi:O-antigen/teichoic acid export membrane protein
MTRLAPLIGVVIWLWIFSTFLEIIALANQETRLATAFIILAQFTKTVLMAGAVILFTTVEAFIYAAIAQAIVQTFILLIYLKKRFPGFWKSFDPAFFRRQIVYAVPFGLAGILYTIQTDVHNYFVGYRFSEAEFAIYAYGCFELPLIAMLYESISAVMIPRMSELESQGKKREMVLTTASAMQKLAFAYFPLFVFMMIVAEEFITTLFTKDYAASVPIFRINLLLLPFYCLMIDPVARAFPEVGRFLLKTRIALFFVLISALYFGIQYFNLRGMIAIVVAFVLFERMISVSKIIRVLEISRKDFYLLKNVGKTAIAAAISGIVLFAFYWFAKDFLLGVCLNFSREILTLVRFEKVTDLIGGGLFLGICFLIFMAIYLSLANKLGAIENDDKEKLRSVWRRLKRGRAKTLDLKLETVD